MSSRRDTSRDGLANRIEARVLAGFPAFWRLVMAIGPLRQRVNRRIIDRAARRGPARPHQFSSMPVGGDPAAPIAGYTSWESLTDQRWFARYLAPVRQQAGPDTAEVAALFRVPERGPTLSTKSSVLFMSFAQWFTDGFLMTDPAESRRTHTIHQIDFNQLYGLTREETRALRNPPSGGRGRLKHEAIAGEVLAPRLHDAAGNVKAEFRALRPPLHLDRHLKRVEAAYGAARAAEVRASLFAFGGERASTTPYTAALNTLFLREHNRLAAMIEKSRPEWDDERVFQTARNINTVLLLKIVIEEYINHIAPYHFKLAVDPVVAWGARWNRPNWIPIEFNLLYRWHSLTPDRFRIGGETVAGADLLFDGSHLTRVGLAPLLVAASRQPAWKIGLFNTPDFLLPVEAASIEQGRRNELASYNDYRALMGFPRLTRFEQISGDPARVEGLRRVYGGDIDAVEFFVGLFAEDPRPGAAVPPLIGRMVALDAFTQALTNPLLAESVWNAETFTSEGLTVIEDTQRLENIMNRNLAVGQPPIRASMDLATGAAAGA